MNTLLPVPSSLKRYKDEKTKLTFKEEVTWTCVSGYKMGVPAHKTRQCTATGDWTGTKPVCVKQSCGVPGGGSTMKIPKHTNLVGSVGTVRQREKKLEDEWTRPVMHTLSSL